MEIFRIIFWLVFCYWKKTKKFYFSIRRFYGYPLIKTSSLVHTQQLVQSRNWRRRHVKKKISGFSFLSIFWRICSLSSVCTSIVYINFLTLNKTKNYKYHSNVECISSIHFLLIGQSDQKQKNQLSCLFTFYWESKFLIGQ